MVRRIRLSPMLGEVLAHIFKSSATRRYPYVKPKVPDDFRGKEIFDLNLCISCGLCARDCSANAIEMVDVDGKKRPLFHLDLCVFCYQCAESCPRNAIISSPAFELASTNKSDLVVSPKKRLPNTVGA